MTFIGIAFAKDEVKVEVKASRGAERISKGEI